MLMVDENFGGIAELLAFAFAALLLDFAELLEGLLELTGEALAVEAEGGECTVGVEDIELGIGRVSGAREQLGFEVWNSIEAPGGVGEFVDQLGFGGGGWLVFIQKLLEVEREHGRILGGEDGGAGGESVAQGIERRSLFAGWGARTGGVLGIGSICGGAICGGAGGFRATRSGGVEGFAALEPA